jgi:hypothetical protein
MTVAFLAEPPVTFCEHILKDSHAYRQNAGLVLISL